MLMVSPPPLPDGSRLVLHELPPASSAVDVCLGGRVWEAVPVLCEWLCRSSLHGSSLIELGGGTGAVGIYAAALGAAKTVLTEGGPDCDALLELQQRNVEANRLRLSGSIQVLPLHWGSEALQLPTGPFDLAIGSDIVWAGCAEEHRALATTIRTLLLRDPGISAVLSMTHGLATEPANGGEELLAGDWVMDETLEEFRDACRGQGLTIFWLEDTPGACGTALGCEEPSLPSPQRPQTMEGVMWRRAVFDPPATYLISVVLVAGL